MEFEIWAHPSNFNVVGEFAFSASWNLKYYSCIIKHFSWCNKCVSRLFNIDLLQLIEWWPLLIDFSVTMESFIYVTPLSMASSSTNTLSVFLLLLPLLDDQSAAVFQNIQVCSNRIQFIEREMFVLLITSLFSFTYSAFTVSCLFFSSNNFFLSFLGLGSKIQSRWKQDCFCIRRSISKYIWLPSLIVCFILWSVTLHYIWLNPYKEKEIMDAKAEFLVHCLSFLSDFLLLFLSFDMKWFQ
jgi:hypothetical protein